jgi:hypothetical protein
VYISQEREFESIILICLRLTADSCAACFRESVGKAKGLLLAAIFQLICDAKILFHYIVAAVSDICVCLSCLCRYVLGVTDEERQERREQVLGTSVKDFRQFAEVLDCARGDAARVVAVTSADKAAQVLLDRPDFWEVKKVL